MHPILAWAAKASHIFKRAAERACCVCSVQARTVDLELENTSGKNPRYSAATFDQRGTNTVNHLRCTLVGLLRPSQKITFLTV
jgi:hypothetical protein